jgi:broad specificity phosphatase PhoE
VVILLRHAHALDKQSWTRPDVERPLSPRGEAQAQALVTEMPWRLARLVSSPSMRCRQTVEPLAVHRQLEVEVDERLAPDVDPAELDAWLDRWVANPAGEDVLLCTHGETLAALLSRWTASGRLNLGQPGQPIEKNATAKSGGWVLTPDGGQLLGRYLPPPAVLEGELR